MLHIETLPQLKQGARLIIVGDIHGCVGEFNNLVEKARYNPEKGDVLLLLGDLVNKGYDSVGVVRRAMQLKAKCILGNHDVALLNHIMAPDMGNENDPLWQLAQGFPPDCVAYLKSLPYAFRVPQFNLIIVHAGMNPKVPLEEQNVWELIHMRSIDEKTGQCWEDLKGSLWAHSWKGPEHVIFGHDARTGLQQCEFATGIDTGCCYGKYLTGIIYPGAELIQVRSKFSQTREARAAAGAAKTNFGGGGASSSSTFTSPAGVASKNAIFNTTPPNARVDYNLTPQQQQQQQQQLPPSYGNNNNNNNNTGGFTGINVADLLNGHKRVTSNSTPSVAHPSSSQQQQSMTSNNNNNNASASSSSSFNLQAFADKMGMGDRTSSSSQQQQQQQQQQQNDDNQNNSIMRFFTNKTPTQSNPTAETSTSTFDKNTNNNNNTNNIVIPAPKTRQSGNVTPTPQQQQQTVTTSSTFSSNNNTNQKNDDDVNDETIVSPTKNKQQQQQQQDKKKEEKLSRREKEAAAKKERQEARKAAKEQQQQQNTSTASASTTTTTNKQGLPPAQSPAQQGKTPTCSRALAVRELCTAGLPRPQFEDIVLQLLDPNNSNNNDTFDSVLKDTSIREAVWFDVGFGLLHRLEQGKQGDEMLTMAQDLFEVKPQIAKQIIAATKGEILNSLSQLAAKVSQKELPQSGLTSATIKETILCLKV